ncbi:hypothetical protein PTKU46_88890 [Paraburkholderia terrae]|uniref:tautomerase family protein n=1 Tax=Paraburkholderia terrae TaxID=311230 RepID=UPI0030E43047
MPHIIVKLWPGESERQKERLAEAIANDVQSIFGYAEKTISVASQEIVSSEWAEKVYQPDIVGHPERLYKKPGYTM